MNAAIVKKTIQQQTGLHKIRLNKYYYYSPKNYDMLSSNTKKSYLYRHHICSQIVAHEMSPELLSTV